MDQEHCRESISCPTCHRTLCWPSRTGRRVCMACYPDPLRALEVLAGTTRHPAPQAPEPYQEACAMDQLFGAV
jgi:hypothetical protein